nr:MAG TPA: hypothetical protein [Caudoviricetes sp.]
MIGCCPKYKRDRFPYTIIVSLKTNTCLRESTTH